MNIPMDRAEPGEFYRIWERISSFKRGYKKEPWYKDKDYRYWVRDSKSHEGCFEKVCEKVGEKII